MRHVTAIAADTASRAWWSYLYAQIRLAVSTPALIMGKRF